MRIALLGATIAALLLASPAGAAADTDPLLAPEAACPGSSDLSLPVAQQVQAMVCLHRYARSEDGIGGLHVSRRLQSSAARKARDIRRCQQFSHEACGRDAFYWFARVGYLRGNFGAAENLALEYGAAGTPRYVMGMWLNSPEHRANLLNRRYDQVGISLLPAKFHGSEASIWVAHLGYHHH